MNSIIEKLGSYQIMTNLLPGAFFGLGIKFFLGLNLPTENIGEDIIIFYFIGFIINRIGSLVVESVFKKIRFVKYVPYLDFAKAVKSDSKIDTLSEMNSYIRSLLTCVLLFPVVWILYVLSLRWIWFSVNWKWCAIILLFVLFLFSYRKQTCYVCKSVEAVNSQNAENKGNKS